jgi:hypothetical protein
MNSREILEALDRAGEALAGLGEPSIVFGRHDNSDIGSGVSFSCRLDLAGTTGVQASSREGWSSALVKALAARADKQRELEEEAEIRAEIEARRSRKAA